MGAVVLLGLGGAALWLLRAPSPEPRVPVSSSRPNVVLITIDTLRADRVGRGLTPNIDRLAARGRTHVNVRATAPLTLPSHLSIMTGLTPPAHGVRENGLVFDRKSRTLARAFRDAGYRTAAFVGAYVLNRRFAIDEGFETFDDAVTRDPRHSEMLESERRGAEVVDAALQWLPSVSQPFFMWVHLYDPHAPYDPPKEFLDKANRIPYDGEVAYADAQVGRLTDGLATRSVLQSTIVAVTGDHGEGLGEHGEQTHGMFAYDTTLRVPLVIVTPGEERSQRELRTSSLAALGSVLLQGAGMSVEGFGEAPEVYAESRYPIRAGWHPLSVLLDDRWKLILSSERELYAITKDPGEQRNVAADHPQVVEAMAATARKLSVANRAEAAVAPDAAERLRALGYVSGSPTVTTENAKAPNPARMIEAWTQFERALGELRDGTAENAVGMLRGLAAAHPDAFVFQTTYAQALREAGHTREAVAVYRTAVRKWPNEAALFHDLAVAAREAGDLSEALRAEQASLALNPTSAMAQNGIGLLLADAGRTAEAAAAFEKATKADPINSSYWTNLGNARRAMNDLRGAEGAYRKAIEIDASFADALNGLGTLLVQSGRAADAIPMFQRALAADAALHEARLNLGIAYQESGQKEKAAETYRQILAMAPASASRERKAAETLLRQLR